MPLGVDASAAMGISKRRGPGKVRRIELSQLWLEANVINNEIEMREVKGEDNKADALTNHVDQRQTGQHMSWTGQSIERGRHELAPEVEQ